MITRLGCADRNTIGLKPREDRGADVLGWPLKLCGCSSIYGPRQLSWAKHRQSRVVLGSHDHETILNRLVKLTQ